MSKLKTAFARSISTSDLAWLLGCSTRNIALLCDQRVLTRTAHGQFDAAVAVQAVMNHRITAAAEEAGGGEFARARARLMTEKAEMARLDRIARQGDSIPAADVQAAFSAMAAHIKQKLLAIPRRVAAKFGMVTNAVEAEALVRSEVHWALDDLSQTIVVRPGDPPDVASA
jgi:phage terminase Nu1 subunit (DNA packaging protein)